MPAFDRRRFLGSSLGGLAAAMSLGPALLAEEAVVDLDPVKTGADEFAPDSLFLTWQKDPTTTMTVQWIDPEIHADSSISYVPVNGAPHAGELWQVQRTITLPFPNTDLKVHR